MKLYVVPLFVAGIALAQEPVMRKGVSVQMAVAHHAVEVRGADEANATVVAITADGKIYSGVERVEPGALSQLSATTVYVKADARTPFQTVLSVVDALRGKSVVLLSASPSATPQPKFVWPYGTTISVAK